jgi:hypothetical protein
MALRRALLRSAEISPDRKVRPPPPFPICGSISIGSSGDRVCNLVGNVELKPGECRGFEALSCAGWGRVDQVDVFAHGHEPLAQLVAWQ